MCMKPVTDSRFHAGSGMCISLHMLLETLALPGLLLDSYTRVSLLPQCESFVVFFSGCSVAPISLLDSLLGSGTRYPHFQPAKSVSGMLPHHDLDRGSGRRVGASRNTLNQPDICCSQTALPQWNMTVAGWLQAGNGATKDTFAVTYPWGRQTRLTAACLRVFAPRGPTPLEFPGKAWKSNKKHISGIRQSDIASSQEGLQFTWLHQILKAMGSLPGEAPESCCWDGTTSCSVNAL